MLRNITTLFCILTLMVQIFAPFFVTLFFAVSPLQVFFGEYLKAGQETTQNSFICPMGIEWEAGSEQYLSSVFGHNHNHDHSVISSPTDIDMHHDHLHHITEMDHSAHMNHNNMEHNTDETKPEPCPIEQVLMFFASTALYDAALLSIILLIIFFTRQIRPYKVLSFFTSRRDLFNLFPLRQAPPAFA